MESQKALSGNRDRSLLTAVSSETLLPTAKLPQIAVMQPQTVMQSFEKTS